MGGDRKGREGIRVALVLPCYNCLPEIEGVVRDYLQFFGPEDVFLIDDGSDGDLRSLAERYGVKVLRHGRNLGKGAALRTGFREALRLGYTHVMTADADGQHPARFVPDFLRLASHYDLVIGSRRGQMERMPFHRLLSNRITSTFISVMVGKRVEDSQSGFRLIRSSVLKAVPLTRTRYDMESELLVKAVWMGFSVGFVPIDVVPSNRSFISPLRDVLRAVTLAAELIVSRA